MSKLPTRIDGPVAVIGDVHGQTDKLHAVLDRLSRLPDFEQRWIVFIGDLVDRGPDPKGAVDDFLELRAMHPRTAMVSGNHEFAMGAALGLLPVPDFAKWPDRWVDHYDADRTFSSYDAAYGDLDELNERLPESHREWLVDLPWVVEHPKYLFVHAGLDPNQPIDVQLRILRQRDYSLTRPPWLCSKSFVEASPPPDCKKAVVSGHVYVPEVRFGSGRVLIDTTGGTQGELSCVLLPERKVISSGGSGRAGSTSASSKDRSWWGFLTGAN